MNKKVKKKIDKKKKIDDVKLIEILKENARTNFTDLARIFNVSETAIRKKIKKLEKEGIIKSYTINFDLKKLGYNIHALVGVDTKPDLYVDVIDKIKKLKETKSLFASTGDHMLLLEVWFEDSKKLREFVKKLKKIKGITRVCPAVLLEKLK